ASGRPVCHCTLERYGVGLSCNSRAKWLPGRGSSPPKPGVRAVERATGAKKPGAHGGDRRSEGFHGAIGALKRGDNQADYPTARIARDRPDIPSRMKAGEFKSVRAAAAEAGFVRRTAAVPLEPAASARRRGRAGDRTVQKSGQIMITTIDM